MRRNIDNYLRWQEMKQVIDVKSECNLKHQNTVLEEVLINRPQDKYL
jgi:hypothetical protein